MPLRERFIYPQHFYAFMGIIDENLASARFKQEKNSSWDCRDFTVG